MDTLDRMPFKARKAVFERLEKLASKANMTQEERMQVRGRMERFTTIILIRWTLQNKRYTKRYTGNSP